VNPHQRHFAQPKKKRLAAPQKTIYNQNAKDGTRQAGDAFFSSLWANFSFWLGATSHRADYARFRSGGE